MSTDITALIYDVDNFRLSFESEYNKRLLENGTRKRIRLDFGILGCHSK